MKPDFSGEYVLNRPASKLSPGADSIDAGSIWIEHREPVVRYSARFDAGGKTAHEFSFELRTDAPETDAETDGARMYWEGDALVSGFRTRKPDPALTIVWRHELVDGGRRLRASETLRGEGRDQDNVWEFERQRQ